MTYEKFHRRVEVNGVGHHVFIQAASGPARPTVLFSHGFATNGLESHRMFIQMANEFLEGGFNTVLFDHIGCGYSDGKFEDFLISRAVDSLRGIFDWMVRQSFCQANGSLLIGQSLGTAVGVEALAGRRDLAGMILWNLSAEFKRRYPPLFGREMAGGKSICIRDKGLITNPDFIRDATSFDVLDRFPELVCPVLFVSCGADEKSDQKLVAKAARTLRSRHETVTIKGANHSFKCQPALEAEARAKSLSWATRYVLHAVSPP